MTDALEDPGGTVNIRGRTIANLRFAGDIDGLAGGNEELANLVECLVEIIYREYDYSISGLKYFL